MENKNQKVAKNNNLAEGVTETDYWKGKWKVGTRVCSTDGEWTIGWGKIISISSEDNNWAKVQLEKENKIVDAYKGYTYLEVN